MSRHPIRVIKRADFAHCPPVDPLDEARAAWAPTFRRMDRIAEAALFGFAIDVGLHLLRLIA